MPAADQITLKHFLRAECLPALAARAAYFSHAEIRRFLARHRVPATAPTLRRYLHEAVAEGHIHDAGRRWYSRLETPFKLHREPVRGLVELLEKRFPLLGFSCWSTEQIASYGHLQLARFVAFVHTERDAMESVATALRDAGWQVWLHPTRQEAAKSFRTEEKTVVVRPAVSRAPVEGRFAAVEKILVDVVAETRAMRLLDEGEYRRLVVNLAGRHRISVDTLAAYARRRGVELEAVLGGVINDSQNKTKVAGVDSSK